MLRNYKSIGLMSGTSGDGVDASVINSNGVDQFELVKDKYFEYDSEIFNEIHSIKDKIFHFKDLNKFSDEITNLERKITIFHAKLLKNLILIMRTY